MKAIAIFASGGGSNAGKIIEWFRDHDSIRVSLVVTNRSTAGVISIAQAAEIPVIVLEKVKFIQTGYVDELRSAGIDWIILAGFLWKIPGPLLSAYPKRIINIHPALLPKFGGQGMYGHFVHEAVIAAGETKSGMTIHYIDGEYDRGDTIFQASCDVDANDTAATLAARVLELEHRHYPAVIEKVIKG